MVGLLKKPQLSKVNARHLLENLASSYSYPLEEAVIVEMIANSLDANSTEIHISLNINDEALTVEDDGGGMGQEDFEKYHDLAESRKERGHGIGFAGLGAKLAHRVARKIVTETRSGAYRDASDWRFKGDDLEWTHTRSRTLQHNGTKVTLHLEQRRRRMLDRGFVEDVIEHHYGALLDPFLSDVYVWESVYPQGVTFYIDGRPLPKRPLVPAEAAEKRKEIDVYSKGKGRRRIGRAVFASLKEPVPEEQQGIAIATYGKTIRRDALNAHPRHPDHITGWFESPDLVECLTTNKQDFLEHGRLGTKFKRIRRELQSAFSKWLREIDEAQEPEERRRAPKRLEQETARLLRRIPELRYLFGAPVRERVARPYPSGDTQSTMVDLVQLTRGLKASEGGGNGAAVSPGDEEGHALRPEDNGQVQTRLQPRTIRGGPHIVRVADPSRREISWVEGDAVVINTAHPAYTKAGQQRLLGYHERIAVYYALCQEAAVEPEEKLKLLNRALTEWGRA